MVCDGMCAFKLGGLQLGPPTENHLSFLLESFTQPHRIASYYQLEAKAICRLWEENQMMAVKEMIKTIDPLA